MDRNVASTLRTLRVQWALLTVTFILAGAAGGHTLFRTSVSSVELWYLGCFAVIGFQATLSWRYLSGNGSPGSRELRPSIGIANSLTLFRGFLVGLLAGFALAQTTHSSIAALPATLYAANLILDIADGAVARATGKRSALGEVLEHELDSLGVLAASIIVVNAGTLGPWFVAVGAARYLFLAATGLRRRLGLPCRELVHSNSGRLIAGTMMAFLLAALWPGVPDGAVRAVAVPLTVLFLGGFVRDWLAICRRPSEHRAE